MNTKFDNDINRIMLEYDTVLKVMEHNARESDDTGERAYGGFVRAAKGKLQEYITHELIKTSWINLLGQNESKIEINSKKIKIPINSDYLESLANETARNFLMKNIDDVFYGLSVDKHVFVNDEFVLAIECKSYAENAMLKRILVDFHLLKTQFPNIVTFLFQLESQLGGDYSSLPNQEEGSKPTHTIMSYFPDVDLRILTLVEGERHPSRPINKFFKPISKEQLKKAAFLIESELRKYCK